MLKIGVIGYGYWGPNIVRNVMAIKGSTVDMICDQNPKMLDKARDLYPHVTMTTEVEDVFMSDVDAVAIITPVSTHYALAKAALESGKHIFVEKPFTHTSAQAQELIDLAEQKNLTIMVDHTFVFTGAVRKIKQIIDEGHLGKLYYYDATRVSLGLFQKDVNVIWDLAPHDFSVIDYIMDSKPLRISAQGVDHFHRGQENISYITVYYENDLIMHLNVNWLSPVKIRHTLIGGEKKMLVWDDLQADERIKVYDKGLTANNKEGMYDLMVDYRSGDIWSPRVDQKEALRTELEYFVHCIENNETPINDGHAGMRIVRMLECTDVSLKNSGKIIAFDEALTNSVL